MKNYEQYQKQNRREEASSNNETATMDNGNGMVRWVVSGAFLLVILLILL